jgi:hypothetical protein
MTDYAHAVSDADTMRYQMMAQPAAAGDAGQLAEAELVARAAVCQVAWAGPRICMSKMHKTKDACERSKQIIFIDLTALASGTPAASSFALDAYTEEDGSQHVNFIEDIGHTHELFRSADPAALIGALDRLMGDPGSARGPVPGSAAATGSAGGHAAARRWGDQ